MRHEDGREVLALHAHLWLPPVVLVQQSQTLDELSDRRIELVAHIRIKMDNLLYFLIKIHEVVTAVESLRMATMPHYHCSLAWHSYCHCPYQVIGTPIQLKSNIFT